MNTPFEGYEVEARLRPSAGDYRFELDRALSAVLALESRVPDDAFTAATLGVERLGNGIVIGPNGLVLTIGYLVTEAEEVVLTLNDGRTAQGHVLGIDAATGFGLVQALEPLDTPVMTLGSARGLEAGDPVVVAGAGGRAHAAAGRIVARMPFAGYWEYYLENAILTEPAHPHWSGAALIGPTGDLVGVGSLSLMGRSRSGTPMPINMFVPAELLPPILDDLARGKPASPPRPWLGVFAQDGGDQVVVAGVAPGGPADRAELRAGDVILGVGGRRISDLAEFYNGLWSMGPAGTVIPLRVQREEDAFDVEIRSGDRSAMLKKPKFN